ncbi:hypothetical protein GCM10012287_35270 [Streptomyces daqingensis]|uniref:Uncharacterized protein n=1 Tax=Streptomyces daqingensis TaxID=1472640 RepID=A0ABQ2MHQ3_9ACTN|nr:hypothetical protein [Streptomyces daqingensis]GGO51985.1 hypothetical protein GCM10012287_35270 [Streptomyces daqingensis]
MNWQAAAGVNVQDDAAEIVEQVVAELDDEQEDDPHGQEFYPLQVKILAVNALSVYLNPAARQAEMSGQTMQPRSVPASG